MTFEIAHEAVLSKLGEALEASQNFSKNIETHVKTLRNTDDEDAAVGIAKSIAYNRRMSQLYLERAAAILELVGMFDTETDCVDYPTIRNKTEAIRLTARL